MKNFIKSVLIIGLLLCVGYAHSQAGFPHSDLQKNSIESPDTGKTLVPLVVLKTNDRTVEMENQDTRISLNDVDVNSISTIEVLKDYAALDLYGEKAKDGVIIIYLKNYESLPEKTKKLFELEKKKEKDEKRN